MYGKVLFYNSIKGIGRILGEDSELYFVHYSKIVGRDYKILYKGERVSFEVKYLPPNENDGEKHHMAININVIEEKNDTKYLRLNPFTPDRPVNSPDRFAGRRKIIIDTVTALQNNENILITGDRGIGKSSLANQLYLLSTGNKCLLERYDIKIENNLDYAPISIRLLKDYDIATMSKKIIHEYIQKYELFKIKTEHEFDFKIYKLKVKHEDEEKDITDLFNYDIIKIAEALKKKNGLLIFIDEIENIDPEAGLSNFIKNVTEYFNIERKKINFIMSGINSASTKHFLVHRSFNRLFTSIQLKELSMIEADEFLTLYLENNSTHIMDSTRSKLIKASRGLPVNLQLLGFYSYQLDDDNRISKNDLDDAIEHILEVKKNEYANRHESIGFGLPEEILKYIYKEKKFNEIKIDFLLEKFQTDEIKVIESLNKLEKCELITKYAKGRYFIKDYLFHLYLQKHYYTF